MIGAMSFTLANKASTGMWVDTGDLLPLLPGDIMLTTHLADIPKHSRLLQNADHLKG
jgi:hypothetical protein